MHVLIKCRRSTQPVFVRFLHGRVVFTIWDGIQGYSMFAYSPCSLCWDSVRLFSYIFAFCQHVLASMSIPLFQPCMFFWVQPRCRQYFQILCSQFWCWDTLILSAYHELLWAFTPIPPPPLPISLSVYGISYMFI